MAAYTYVAKDSEGRVIRASVSAMSQTAALADLRTRGLAVVDITAEETNGESAIREPVATSRIRKRRRSRRVPLGELAMCCRQLSIAVGSGMSLRDALESIVVDIDNVTLEEALEGVLSELKSGVSFSDALSKRVKVFGSLFVALMRAAEESGSMALTLDQLAVYLERSERLENKIKRSSTYPVFVLVFFCIVCTVMTAFVLPRFHEIFAGFDADLPLISELVFQLNRGLLRAAPWLGAVGAILVLGYFGWRRTAAGRNRIDSWKLRVPLFGSWLQKFAMARFCRNLAMMLRGGVPVTTAMEITASVSGNHVIRESVLRVRERLISGMSVSESLGENPEFPRLVVRMVAMGEESGSLPEVLEKVSDVYEDQVEGSITVAMTLLEPIVICVFGFVVMLLILAIYMPVFTIGTNVR